MNKNHLANLTDEQHATVLAALRFYQREGMGDPACRSEEIDDLATNGGEVTALDVVGISDLCEQLNCRDTDFSAALQVLKQSGMDFGECVNAYGETAIDSPYVRYAVEISSDGDFEIDGTPVVSKGEEPGAYVMGWLWVSDYDCGVQDNQVASD